MLDLENKFYANTSTTMSDLQTAGINFLARTVRTLTFLLIYLGASCISFFSFPKVLDGLGSSWELVEIISAYPNTSVSMGDHP